MPLPLVTDRPEKTIDSIVSRWNAGDLPLIYDITNTKWPVNSEDSTVAITSISDDNGSARLNHGSSTGLVVKEWVNVAGTTNYNGPHQITAVSGNNLTIDFPFGVSETGTSQRYFQNYTTLIRVNVGLDPIHEFVALKPNTLVGTIEQRPDTDNITLADVKEYVKNKLNTIYDESQTSWPNDVNAWTDFYISFAERYDLVTAGVVGDFTSVFTDDTNVDGIIFLHAIHGALQFGDTRGGNMFDFVVFDSTDAGGYFDGSAKFMTFFERLKIIDYNNFNVSIILDKNAEYPDLNIIRLEITEFDQNDNVLLITILAVPRQDYGLYRIDFEDIVFQDDTTYIEIVLLDTNSFEVSETKTVDIDVECFVFPAAPTDLAAAISNPQSSIDLEWAFNEEEDTVTYRVERSTDEVVFTQVAEVSGKSFIDTSLTTNIYFYRVRAVINGAASDPSGSTSGLLIINSADFSSAYSYFTARGVVADNFDFSSGILIEKFKDRVGDFDLNQSTVSLDPEFAETGINSINNKPCARRQTAGSGEEWVGADDFSDYNFLHDGTTSYTVIIAWDPDAGTTTVSAIVTSQNQGSNRGFALISFDDLHVGSADKIRASIRSGSGGGGITKVVTSSIDVVYGDINVAIIRFDLPGDDFKLKVENSNGEAEDNDANVVAFSASNSTQLLRMFDHNSTTSKLKVAEFITFKAELSDADTDTIRDLIFSYYS